MTAAPAKPVKVFYSYAHEDTKLLEKLKTHLAGLKQRKLISEWHDGEISAGSEWDKQIVKQLESADVILLLVSPDFINSDYSNNVEVKKAIERHKAGTAIVIPVILRPVNWSGLPFSNLQVLPSGARAVTTWPNEDEAFLDVENGIETAIAQLSFAASSSETSEARLSPYSYIEPQAAIGFVQRKDRDGKDLIERLRVELAPGRARIVSLSGPGGVGKTALAAEATRSLIQEYKQRVAWISADGRDEFVLTSLLDEIAHQLGSSQLRTFSVETKKIAVQELVGKTPSLIIFDNFETVRPKEQVRCLEWLSHLAPASVLITTRAQIELSYILNLPIQPMLDSEATEFLDRLIQQAQHPANFEGVDKRRIIETAEANPLILRWIVGQIDLAQDWREVLDELAHGEGDAAHRVFDRSFKLPLLNNGGRAALLALSLFVPSASRSALADVAGLGDDNKKRKFKEAIRHLAALWLIRTTEGGTRLTVEGLTRDLAKARLGSDPRRTVFYQRFVVRFGKFARANSLDTAYALNSIASERENVLAAIDVAIATKSWKTAIAIYSDALSFLNIRGYWDEAIGRGEKVKIAAFELHDQKAMVSIAVETATILSNRGEYDAAEQTYHEVLPVFRQLKADPQISVTLFNLGALYLAKGDISKTRKLYEESLEIDKRCGNHSSSAATLSALAHISHIEGDTAEARQLFNSSLEILERFRDSPQEGNTVRKLGQLDEAQGEVKRARELFIRSLEIERKLGHQWGVVSALQDFGNLMIQQGHLAEALKLTNESLEISESLGHQSGIAMSLQLLGTIAHEEEKRVEARQYYEDSREIRSRLGSPIELAFSLHQIGKLDVDEGKLSSAEKLLNQSLEIFRNCNARVLFPESLETLGTLRAAQGSFDDARALYLEALQSAEAMSYKFKIASIKHSLGLLAERENDLTEAADLLQESLTLFEPLSSPKIEKVKVDLERVKAAAMV